MQDRELTLYAEKMAKSIASLKEINEELEQEIAQRRLPEEAVRRSEEKYSSLVESTAGFDLPYRQKLPLFCS